MPVTDSQDSLDHSCRLEDLGPTEAGPPKEKCKVSVSDCSLMVKFKGH